MSSFWHRLIDGFKSRTSTELGELPAACCRTAWARDTLNGTSGCTWKFRVCHTGLSFGWYEAAVHNILSIPLDSTVMKPWVPGLVGETWDPVTQLLYCSVINAAWSMLGCNLCAWWCQRRVPSWKAEGKFTSGEGTEAWRDMVYSGSRAVGAYVEYVGVRLFFCRWRAPGGSGRGVPPEGPEKASCGSGESDLPGRLWKQRWWSCSSLVFEIECIMCAVPIEILLFRFFRIYLAKGPNCTFVLQFS